MGVQSMNLYCHKCQHETGHVKSTTSHGLHFLISLFTLGLWVIPWICISIFGLSPAKCSRCGSSYNQTLAVQTAARLDTERRQAGDRLGRAWT